MDSEEDVGWGGINQKLLCIGSPLRLMIRHAYQSVTAEVDHMKNEHIKKIHILNLASVTLLRFLFTLACCGNKTSYQYKCLAVQHG